MKATVSADRVIGAFLVVAYAAFAVAAVFSRRESYDTIAYVLPGANLVTRGVLDVHQLGSQYGFDRFWLFNSPVMVLGPVPLFALLGVGRLQALAGVAALAVANLLVIAWIMKRHLGVASSAVAVLLAFAFLGTRGMAVADLYNQRYAVAAFGCMALAFAPRLRGGPTGVTSSLAAGLLPLIHPVLAPASGVFLITRLLERQWSRRGLAAFAGCAIAGLAWYVRPTALETQFVPHVRYGQFRSGQAFSGLLDAAASPVAAVPTRVLAAAIVVTAVGVIVGWAASRNANASVRMVRSAAVALLIVLVLDAWRGFPYAAYYVFGLGPVLMSGLPGRRAVVRILAVVAVAHIGVAARLDRWSPDWTSTEDTRDALLHRTRPGERLALGPPFVLAASLGVAGRSTPAVVPQPYFLDPFDAERFVLEINARCSVYVGAEEWYRRPVWTDPAEHPLFSRAVITRWEFKGQPVIVARRVD